MAFNMEKNVFSTLYLQFFHLTYVKLVLIFVLRFSDLQ